MRIPKHIKYIVGIDEAGRGPLAGPVSIGFVLVEKDNLSCLADFCDSKIIKEAKRELLYKNIQALAKEGLLEYSSSLISEKMIDQKGITFAIETGIKRVMSRFNLNPDETLILLDGLLKAPKKFSYQKTINKGDRDVRIIGTASIVAKVRRDRKMKKLAGLYPKYNFHKHKGYGTKEHIDCLKNHGLCEIHRKTFC